MRRIGYILSFSWLCIMGMTANVLIQDVPGVGGYVQQEWQGANSYRLTAVPNEGYEFLYWIDGTNDNPRLVALTKDTMYRAVFAYSTAIHYEKGEVNVQVKNADLPSFVLEAQADTCNALTHWSNGKKTQAITYSEPKGAMTATFARTDMEYKVGQDPAGVVLVEDLECGYRLTARANTGYVFYEWENHSVDTVRDVDFVETTYQARFVTDDYTPVRQTIFVQDSRSSEEWHLSPHDGAYTSVHVLNNGILTISENTQDTQLVLDSLCIYGGGKVVVPTDCYLSVKHIILLGGDSVQNQYLYRYPQLVVNGHLHCDAPIYYDYLLEGSTYYTLALPHNVDVQSVTYTDDSSVLLSLGQYDGAARASGMNGWYSTQSRNLIRGNGYIVNASSKANSKYSRVRFPMNIDLSDGESECASIAVSAYPSQTGKDNDAGWNLIGNPYLANYTAPNGFSGDNGIGLLQEDGKGGYEWIGNLRYVVLPGDDGATYRSVLASAAVLPAFKNFFVQIGEGDALTFPLANRAQSAPMRKQTGSTAMESVLFQFILSAKDSNQIYDQYGVLVGDYTEAYDFNADLAKWHNSQLDVYMPIGDYELAYAAISEQMAQLVPLSISASVAGVYTMQMDLTTADSEIEVDLLYQGSKIGCVSRQPLSISLPKGLSTDYALSISTKRLPTGVENMGVNCDVEKLLRENQLIIIRAGKVYNALGQELR